MSEIVGNATSFFTRRIIVDTGTEGSVLFGGLLPGQQRHSNSTVVVVHGSANKTKNSDSERDSESITLDQFLDECNKSPKSRVCRLQNIMRIQPTIFLISLILCVS